MTFKNLIWPCSFTLLCFLVSSKGATEPGSVVLYSLIGAVVGLALSLVLTRLIRKPNVRFGVDIFVGLLWALVIFSIGFPNLKVPKRGFDFIGVIYLAVLALLPLMFVLLHKLIISGKHAPRDGNGSNSEDP